MLISFSLLPATFDFSFYAIIDISLTPFRRLSASVFIISIFVSAATAIIAAIFAADITLLLLRLIFADYCRCFYFTFDFSFSLLIFHFSLTLCFHYARRFRRHYFAADFAPPRRLR